MNTNSLDKADRQPTSDKGPRSVERILTILETLAITPTGATLSELAKTTCIPKSSMVGLLTGLTRQDCLKRDTSGRYFLGPRFITLAMNTNTNQEFVSLIHPNLVELVNKTGETAIIASLVPDEYLVTFLDKVESPSSIRYTVTIGERRELHCTVAGKLFLTYFPQKQFDTYLKSSRRKKFTEKTLTGKSELRSAIEDIQKDRIARTFDERLVGASALAAPIYSANGTVLAAIMLAGPTERMNKNSEKNERLVLQSARESTHLLGGKLPEEKAI
ncbi:MAG: IclR family transcriptional regulator [Rhodobacteraceae bacterium]|nr:IclR family transcriptional regulator [Paracoccaceae bacterium]